VLDLLAVVVISTLPVALKRTPPTERYTSTRRIASH
jgi:hypothetical protein